MKKTILFLVVALSFSFAQAQTNSDELVPEIKSFKPNVVVTVLNIQKSENSGWQDEAFKKIVEESDLVLIQESVDKFPVFTAAEEILINYFYKSWGDFRYNTGLTTLTKVPFDEAKRLVSPDTEPVAATPKVTSIEKYSVEGFEQKLMVVNTHAINFTGLSAFRRQISAVAKELESHKGPLVWAGDFNTWSSRRKQFLDGVMAKLDLKEVAFSKRSEKFLVLDHAYVRGVQVRDAEQLQLGISDHEPLRFTLNVEESD